MKLSLSQIKKITLGAVRITEQEDGINFYRFTKEQEELYVKRNTHSEYIKTFHTSGVKLCFKTDSKNLFLKLLISGKASRDYFACEVIVNGKRLDTINNFSDVDLPQYYSNIKVPIGEFEKHFNLADGVKEVKIYLPWSIKTVIKEMSIEDGSLIEPIKYKNSLLAFGDSISQGYDALYPSNKYITKLAEFLNAEEFNKAIGAEIFFPELSKTKENFIPDYITVAYGSNDWNRCKREDIEKNCTEFFSNLSTNYPTSKIFAITPIWRKDMVEYRQAGDLRTIADIIISATKELDNVTVINGFDFVPKEEKYFADFRLHPNDEGFNHYFINLSKSFD